MWSKLCVVKLKSQISPRMFEESSQKFMPAKMFAILSTGFEARVQRGYHGNFGFVRTSYDTSHELLRVYV